MRVKLQRLSWALYLLPALALLRGALAPGRMLGGPYGEATRKLFGHLQLLRWLRLEAPVGHADLINWPDGRGFWPVAPLLDLVQLPFSLTLGAIAGLSVLALVLLVLSGVGPYLLVRVCGGGRPGALAAGLVVQLSPFLLTNLGDAIVEVSCVGIAALAVAGLVRWHASGRRRDLALAGLGVFATAASSPYFAIYLAIGCLCAAAWTWRAWRRWLAFAGVAAVACAVAIAPIWLTERGDDGRLSEVHSHGWSLHPGELVSPSTGQVVARRPSTGGAIAAEPPPAWLRSMARWQPGWLVALAALVGLGFRRSRPWSILALVFFALGPGIPMLLRQLGRPGDIQAPLSWLVGGDFLSNPTRLLVPWILSSAVGLGLVIDRYRAWAVACAILALAEPLVLKRGFELPSVEQPFDEVVVDAIDDPFSIFPSGDPPAWQPEVGFGESMLLAGLADQPIGYDFATGATDPSLGLTLRLAEAGDVPVGIELYRSRDRLDEDHAPPLLVLLEDRIDTVGAVRASLSDTHDLVVEGERQSVWRRRD